MSTPQQIAEKYRKARDAAQGVTAPTAGADGAAPEVTKTTQQGGAAAQLAQIRTEAAAQTDAATRHAQAVQVLVNQLDPFEDQHGVVHLCTGVGERAEWVRLDSQMVEDLLREVALNASGRMIGRDTIDAARSRLRTSARGRERRRVYQRVGRDLNGAYYLDLADSRGSAVRVTRDTVDVVKNNDVPFMRSYGYGQLPTPTECSDAHDAWSKLAPLLEGVPESDQLPLVAAVVEYFRPDTPDPIIELWGPEGSGKTSLAKRIASVLDPFDGQLPSTRFDVRDIVAASQHRRVIVVDNASGTNPAGVEDLLCQRATGAVVVERAFYTNAGTCVNNVSGPTLITGIQPVLRQADARDRTLSIGVARPRAYRPESDVQREFLDNLPDVLGGLLFFLRETLAKRETVRAQREWRHRMVDWAVSGEAIAQSLGHAPGYFVDLMAGKRKRAAHDYIEGDTFASALVKCLHKWGEKAQRAERLPSYRQWHPRPGWCSVEICGRIAIAATAQAICTGVFLEGDSGERASSLPGTARATTGALQRVQGVLGRAGIEADLRPINGGRNNAWVFLLPHGGEE